VFTYFVINLFIVPMNFYRYAMIEIIITVMHMLYNRAKKDYVTNKPQ
jgi:hypothetical protein